MQFCDEQRLASKASIILKDRAQTLRCELSSSVMSEDNVEHRSGNFCENQRGLQTTDLVLDRHMGHWKLLTSLHLACFLSAISQEFTVSWCRATT